MGVCCSNKQDNNGNKKSNQQKFKMSGKGIQIGGGQDEQNNAKQHELIAQATEARLQKQQMKGMNQESKIRFEMTKQKLEEAEKYKQEGRGNTNLRWD